MQNSRKSTFHTGICQGIPIGIPNKITKKENTHHISYNNYCIDIYSCDTTAIFINETAQFLILNGNHVNEYNSCNSLKECLEYFYKNVDKANKKSEHGEIFKISEDFKAAYIPGGY